MLVKRKLPCEICNTSVPIRSTIKKGELKGKKICNYCKNKHDSKPKKPIKVKEKRKKEREGLPKFFSDAIEDLRLNPVCQNCGGHINISYEPVRNIAHILPKQRYKSVMSHPDNRLFLCAGKDFQNSCHEKFDSGISTMLEMPCLELAVENFKKFKGKVTEGGKIFHTFEEIVIRKI